MQWSARQIQFLKDNYYTQRKEVLMKYLNLEWCYIVSQANKDGLKSRLPEAEIQPGQPVVPFKDVRTYTMYKPDPPREPIKRHPAVYSYKNDRDRLLDMYAPVDHRGNLIAQ